jgi:PAS domain-containing protein
MVKINVRTAELLRETKIKSEQAASQEEEIRQNIEEMQTATDELNKKLDTVSGTMDAIKEVANIAEFDVNGRVTDISAAFLKILKKEKSEVIGKLQGSFSIDAPNIESFNQFWRDLKKGNQKEFEQMINIGDEILRIYSVYIPIINEEGDVYKVTSFSEVIK